MRSASGARPARHAGKRQPVPPRDGDDLPIPRVRFEPPAKISYRTRPHEEAGTFAPRERPGRARKSRLTAASIVKTIESETVPVESRAASQSHSFNPTWSRLPPAQP